MSCHCCTTNDKSVMLAASIFYTFTLSLYFLSSYLTPKQILWRLQYEKRKRNRYTVQSLNYFHNKKNKGVKFWGLGVGAIYRLQDI